MTVNDCSIERFLSFSEEQRQDFYDTIVQNSTFKRNGAACYQTFIRQRKTAAALKPYSRQPDPNGRLMAVEELKRCDTSDNKTYYLCLCDCGTWCIVRADAFKVLNTGKRNNGVWSCGCFNKEKQNSFVHDIDMIKRRSDTLKDKAEKAAPHQGDIINGWEIIETKMMQNSEDQQPRRYMRGVCPQCHKTTDKWIRLDGITSQTVVSCGCHMQAFSLGVQKIINLLQAYDIHFTTEKTFESCLFPDTHAKARFDFWVNESYLIEYDGRQHYSLSDTFTRNEEEFKRAQARDKFKNQ